MISPILLLNPCVWDREIIEESIRFLEDWKDVFPPLDMSRVWSLWDAASLTFVSFLSFFSRGHCNSELFGFYKRKKKRCWSSTWEVVGKEGVLSENGVQPSEQLFKICSCSSDPISKWAMQFAFVPWIASFFFSLKNFLIRRSLDSIFMFLAYTCWIAEMCLLRSSDG